MSKMWQIEANVNDPVRQARLTNTIVNDPLVCRLFPSIEHAHEALDDFCERKGLPMSLFIANAIAMGDR